MPLNKGLPAWRALHFRIGGGCHVRLDVAGGVPRGSMLGPHMFLPFNNGPELAPSSPIQLFANDVTVVEPTGGEDLSSNQGVILDCGDKWDVHLNAIQSHSLFRIAAIT